MMKDWKVRTCKKATFIKIWIKVYSYYIVTIMHYVYHIENKTHIHVCMCLLEAKLLYNSFCLSVSDAVEEIWFFSAAI